MLSSVKTSGFRGIDHGAEIQLAPLTILLGPNGSGKSAILDALLIGSHPSPAEAVGRAVRRRGLTDSARWLLHRADPDKEARIDVSTQTTARRTQLRFREDNTVDIPNHPGPFRSIDIEAAPEPPAGGVSVSSVQFAGDDFYTYGIHRGHPLPVLVRYVHLIDSFERYDAIALARAYDGLLREGRLGATTALVTKLVPHAKELRIGVDAANAPLLYAVFDGDRGAVPLGLAGDGVKLAVRASMGLGRSREGLVLLEEPDAHPHPAAIWLLAKAIVEAVRAGIQVILGTHSLELVDALITESVDDLLGSRSSKHASGTANW